MPRLLFSRGARERVLAFGHRLHADDRDGAAYLDQIPVELLILLRIPLGLTFLARWVTA